MKMLKKVISVFLAAIFLLSSLGFTPNTMACNKSGKSIFSFIPLDDCCKKTDKEFSDDCCSSDSLSENSSSHISFSKSDCCDINNTIFDLSDFQTQKNNFLPKVVSCNLFYITTFQNTITSQLSSLDVIHNDSPPPLLYGRNLLSHVSVLII